MVPPLSRVWPASKEMCAQTSWHQGQCPNVGHVTSKLDQNLFGPSGGIICPSVIKGGIRYRRDKPDWARCLSADGYCLWPQEDWWTLMNHRASSSCDKRDIDRRAARQKMDPASWSKDSAVNLGCGIEANLGEAVGERLLGRRTRRKPGQDEKYWTRREARGKHAADK